MADFNDEQQSSAAAEQSQDDLAAALAQAQADAAQARDQVLRAQAEAENVRRRAARETENARKFALDKFAAELLPVLDSLDAALDSCRAQADQAQDETLDAIIQGLDLSQKLFLDVLGKNGVSMLDPLGEPFDPQLHEAMSMIPSPHAEPNAVLQVLQKGYVLNGRVVRAAKVIVAKAPAGSEGGGGGAGKGPAPHANTGANTGPGRGQDPSEPGSILDETV